MQLYEIVRFKREKLISEPTGQRNMTLEQAIKAVKKSKYYQSKPSTTAKVYDLIKRQNNG